MSIAQITKRLQILEPMLTWKYVKSYQKSELGLTDFKTEHLFLAYEEDTNSKVINARNVRIHV